LSSISSCNVLLLAFFQVIFFVIFRNFRRFKARLIEKNM
jgi:hypothetical protein